MTSFFFLPMKVSKNESEQTKRNQGLAYLCKSLPFILSFLRELPPLLSNDLGDVRVSKPRILSHYCGLIMLPIQDKS
jgi:hypothetical protein